MTKQINVGDEIFFIQNLYIHKGKISALSNEPVRQITIDDKFTLCEAFYKDFATTELSFFDKKAFSKSMEAEKQLEFDKLHRINNKIEKFKQGLNELKSIKTQNNGYRLFLNKDSLLPYFFNGRYVLEGSGDIRLVNDLWFRKNHFLVK